MKKTSLAVLMIFTALSLVFSQDWTGQGRQIGYVYDEQGNPLEGVKVKLKFTETQSGFETVTDAKGKWVAFGIKGGTWYVDFELSGYAPKKIWINVLDFRQKNPEIEVNMKKMEGLFITDDLKDDLLLGNALFEEEKYDEAVEVFQKIVEEFPDAYIVNMNIGNCYFQKGNYDEAEKYYMMVLEKAPENHDVLMGIGNCYSNRGDQEKALEWYNKLEFEKINDPIVLYNVGTIFYNNSKFEEALKYYKKAVGVQEDFLDGRYQLGLAYLALGNNAEALIEFENYLKYDPDSERASQVKGFIEYLKRKNED